MTFRGVFFLDTIGAIIDIIGVLASIRDKNNLMLFMSLLQFDIKWTSDYKSQF